MTIATARLIKTPPPPKALPAEVPEPIESAARRYLDAVKAADLTRAAWVCMDRSGGGYLIAYYSWIDRERVAREALCELVEAIGPGPGVYPVGEWIVRNVNRLGGGAELRIEAGCSAWPGRESESNGVR